MRRIVGIVVVVAALAMGGPAWASHPKVLLHNTEFGRQWGHTHLAVDHWSPNTRISYKVCNQHWQKSGAAACDTKDAVLTTDAAGHARARFYLFAGPVGNGRCDREFDGCSVVVVTELVRNEPDFSTAVGVPLNWR